MLVGIAPEEGSAMKRSSASPLLSGVTYFAVVFVAAFALGAARTLCLAPTIGPAPALAIEFPLVLGLSWYVCLGLIRGFGIDPSARSRLVMGATALSSLIAIELLSSAALFGRSSGDFLHGYGTWLGAPGGLAQPVFAIFPLLQSKMLEESHDS